MAPTMKGTPVARYGSLPRLPWASPTFDDMNMTPVHPIRDPSYMDLPAGVATELYRGPRYEKQPMHVEAASAEWATVYQKPHVPTRGERIRANRAARSAMEWKAEAGGWVQKQGVGQPANAEWRGCWTNWGVDRGWGGRGPRPTSTSTARPNTRRPRSRPASQRPRHPQGAVRRVARRTEGERQARRWHQPPAVDGSAAGLHARTARDAGVVKGDVQATFTRFRCAMAPGTNVAVRGGSWPVKMTVPPDGSPTSVMH